jgi:hypothetical protein
LQNEAADADF